MQTQDLNSNMAICGKYLLKCATVRRLQEILRARGNYFDRYACAIPDPENDEVILTGNRNNYNFPETTSIVSVYNKNGWVRDLAPMNQGRYGHGCTSFVSGGKKVNIFWRDYQELLNYQETLISIYLEIDGSWRILSSWAVPGLH